MTRISSSAESLGGCCPGSDRRTTGPGEGTGPTSLHREDVGGRKIRLLVMFFSALEKFDVKSALEIFMQFSLNLKIEGLRQHHFIFLFGDAVTL